LSKLVVKDFTAKDLQMLAVAMDKVAVSTTVNSTYNTSVMNKDLFDDVFGLISTQTQRRIAQFSSEALVLLLRAFASYGYKDDLLMTRVTTQLPRVAQSFKPIDVATILSVYATMGIQSDLMIAVLSPMVVENSMKFSFSEWLTTFTSLTVFKSIDHSVLDTMTAAMLVQKPVKFVSGLKKTNIYPCNDEEVQIGSIS